MKKYFLISFLIFYVFINNAQAACLNTNEIAVLTKISENLTEQEKLVFYGIFDKLCNISYAYIDNLNNTVIEITDNRIKNYTSWFEEKYKISEAINRIADIYNNTYSIEEINRILETKKIELEDKIDDRFSNIEKELSKYVKNDTIENVKSELTGMITSKVEEVKKSDYVSNAWVFILIAFAGILLYVLFRSKSYDKYRKHLISSSPYIPDRRKITEEAMEQILNERLKNEIERQKRELIEKEAKILEEEFSHDKQIETAKKSLKESQSEKKIPDKIKKILEE